MSLQEQMFAALDEQRGLPWSFTVAQFYQVLLAYPTGVTKAVLDSELDLAWVREMKKWAEQSGVHAKNKDGVLEVEVENTVLSDSGSCVLILRGEANSTEMFLHQRFYSLAQGENCVLRTGQRLRTVDCSWVTIAGRKRLLPSEHTVFLLGGGDWDDMFMVLHFSLSLKEVLDARLSMVATQTNVYARVVSVGEPGWSDVNRTMRCARVVLKDTTSEVKVTLVLWGDQVRMCSLFTQGDFLAVLNPFFQIEPVGEIGAAGGALSQGPESVTIEYGSMSVLFVRPAVLPTAEVGVVVTCGLDSDGSAPTQCSVPVCDGALDCIRLPHRITISELRPNMTNLTLLATVVGSPDEGTIVLSDRTGQLSVQLRGAAAAESQRLRSGHTVLIRRLRTRAASNRARVRGICGDEEAESYRGSLPLVTALESLPACLRCPDILAPTSVASVLTSVAKGTGSSWIVRAVLTAVTEPKSDDLELRLTLDDCSGWLEDVRCSRALFDILAGSRSGINEGEMSRSLSRATTAPLFGTASLGGPPAAEPPRRVSLSGRCSLVGHELLTVVSLADPGPVFHMDVVAEVNAVAEARSLLLRVVG